jgi:tetratricopeptide (TPR) repeat protein
VPPKYRVPPRKKKSPEAAAEPPVAEPTADADNKDGARALPMRLAWAVFYLTLALSIGWVMTDAFLVDRVTVMHCEDLDKGIPPEKRMPLYLNEIAFDGYTWNRHAEELGHNGLWRLRWTQFDNAPKGREVHWNSAFAWYLRGLGEAYRANTGDSLRNSIFRMSIWANPILLVLALGIFATLSARRFGPLCGAVLAVGMVTVPSFYEGFLPAYPDHHGIISFALLGLLFGIAWAGAGWVKKPGAGDAFAPDTLAQARHGMIFSAVCGAASIWFSALSTSIVLGTIGIAALATALLMSRMKRSETCEFHPELWKVWTRWGAGAALGFYLLEYFPNHLGMRMEVNHPFYALAWLGGGWILSLLTGWIVNGRREGARFPGRALVLPLLACAVLPGVILLGGPEVYIPKDPFMAGLWKNISELLPLMKRIELTGMTLQMAFGWFPLFLLAAAVLLALRQVGHGTKAVIASLSIPILLITGLQFYQIRWGLLSGPLYIALAAIVVPQCWRMVPRTWLARGLAAAALLGFAWLFVSPAAKIRFPNNWVQYKTGKITVSPGQAIALLHRQMARTILDSAGDKPVVLLSSPNSSCILSAFGGFRAIGTLYWENHEGLKSAARALNAQTDQEARELLQKHGVTHVSMMSWENFIEPYYNILYPKPVEGKSVMNSFGKRALFDRVIPSWTRPLVFPPNAITRGLQQQVLMLQVAPDQDMNEARFHLARFVRFVEGRPEQAEAIFRQILEAAPKSSLVRVELCDLYLSQKKYREALDEIKEALPDADMATRENFAAQISNVLNAAREWKLQAEWLRTVAESGEMSVNSLLNIAWMLSTLPDAEARYPQFSLRLCDKLAEAKADPVALLLARAAARAAAGDFELAASLMDDPLVTQNPNPEIIQRAAAMREAFKAGKIWTTQ